MKKVLIFILALMTALGGINAYALDITSGAACVINTGTGEFYYDYNADQPLAPASMAKVMTAYIIYEKINEGVINKNTMITADIEDEAASLDSQATNVFLRAGDAYSIDELLGAIMVPSACAACEMVGKYLCGSKEAFWALMNQKAAELGLNAYYADASGLSDDSVISARSMALLATKFINDYPDILNYTSKPYIIFHGTMYKSTNHMLPGDTWEYAGTDGFKTGTTTLAGYCNTSTAVRDGIRLLSVTMHSESPYYRFADTINLLDYGFEQARYYYDHMFATDLGVIINGCEIPSFCGGGANKGLYFIIEDLEHYGFDVHWSDAEQTVTATYNPNKVIEPIPLGSYKAYPVGSVMYNIIHEANIKAEINYNGRIYTFNNVCPLSGYTAVSADELNAIADLCQWSETDKRLYIAFNNSGLTSEGAVTSESSVAPLNTVFKDMGGESAETINAVNLLYQKHYINGKSETEFDPDASISRAEFAAVMLRMLGTMGENRPYYLKDVTKDKWYYYVAGSAVATGIMNGFGDGTFRGDDIIPKAQAAVIAARVLRDNIGADEGSEVIPWIEALPEWAAGSIKIAANAGIIDKNEAFNSDSEITRGEAAVMVARVYDKLKDVCALTDYTGDYENRRPPITIVIDPGHGIDSGLTSNEKRLSDGWIYNTDYNQWGEWRHWRLGEFWHDCEGYGCIQKGDCWYRMENGDRETEPDINLRNAQSAAKYLEAMGYEVRLTRGANDNPSMTKRLIYCYPNNDITAVADADYFVCLHSNAGGGRGSAYIELAGEYDQTRTNPDYAYISNTLGKYINDEIVSQTSVSEYSGGVIRGMPELVLFCKSPVPIAYVEIGFYDNPSDLAILNSEYDMIGKAVADGIDKYCRDTR